MLDASIPVFWASVGDFFGRKSFSAIRGNMNLFYTWGAILFRDLSRDLRVRHNTLILLNNPRFDS